MHPNPTLREPIARKRRLSRGTLALAVTSIVAGLLLAPVAVGAQEEAALPTLGEAMEGGVADLQVAAFTDFGSSEEMLIEVEVQNDTGADATLAVPFGTLLETEVESDQTFGVAGDMDDPSVQAAAANGGTPTLVAAPGSSTHVLTVFCTEQDDGAPFERTEVFYAGMAQEPLPTVLRNIVAQQPGNATAQDAVWWVTDEPEFPVREDIAPLLKDVPAASFSAEPHKVIPDSEYNPRWRQAAIQDEAFEAPARANGPLGSGGGGGAGIWLLVLVVGVAVVGGALALGRRKPQPAMVSAANNPSSPGWYPDPWGAASHRYWSGTAWTDRTMR